MVAEPRAAGAQKEKSTRPAARRRPGSPKGPGAAAPNSRWNPVSRGGAQTAGEAPRRSHKVASVPAFPVRGREVQIALAPPPELCSTRLGKGHCVPGLGSEERLMDPNLGAPRGRSLKFPRRLGRRSTVPVPPAEEGMICNKCVRSGG